MLRDAVRGVVVVAAELAEETGKKVLGAAEGLLARAGVDVQAVERRIAEQFPPSPQSLQTLAGEAVTAGRAGVDLAVGVARSEVERLFEKVGDQVTKVGVVLSFLESKLREVEEEQQPAAERTEARARGLFDAGWETEQAAEPEAGRPSARKAAAGAGADDGEPPASARKRAPAQAAPAHEASAESASAKRAPARAAAKKAPAKGAAAAKKTVARKTSASGAAAKPVVARKAAAKKTVVRKSAQGKPGKREESDG